MNVHHHSKLISRDQRQKDMIYFLRIHKNYYDGLHEWDERQPRGCRVTKTTWFVKSLKY